MNLFKLQQTNKEQRTNLYRPMIGENAMHLKKGAMQTWVNFRGFDQIRKIPPFVEEYKAKKALQRHYLAV